MNYLKLCQDMARDVGIPGSGPDDVESTSLSEEENNIVRYINDANVDIESRWFDWNFLWTEVDLSATADVSILTSPTDLGNWKLETVIWNKTSSDYQILEYMDWDDYTEMYKYGTISTGTPESFSVKPTNVLDLYPTPDVSGTVSAEYFKVPTALAADTDTSLIPARFHRIIIARAKLYYAENEDAPEIMAGSLAEFEDLLDKLEADELPSQKARRFSRVQDLSNFTVVTE